MIARAKTSQRGERQGKSPRFMRCGNGEEGRKPGRNEGRKAGRKEGMIEGMDGWKGVQRKGFVVIKDKLFWEGHQLIDTKNLSVGESSDAGT
ncbi:hypothetical protein E2C01_087981 [Portunus trituberculatus]|uniref:Uncharacterized protein n=1 Tax=Portunus trituberculatus TaxID=210409 RepID=A0A5B7JD99_PORTR|nr:hypothetical protein [Portunus trituberculatus]